VNRAEGCDKWRSEIRSSFATSLARYQVAFQPAADSVVWNLIMSCAYPCWTCCVLPLI